MIDLVVPVYKPDEKLAQLLYKIQNQSIPIGKIILMNTEKEYWDAFLQLHQEISDYENIEIHHIKKIEFDHGNTRNLGISYSKAEYILLMTQDAVPKNEYLLEKLKKNFENPKVAVAYARQLPDKDLKEAEKFTRSFNYPETSRLKSLEDTKIMGIKAFFCSNVCAMYKREIFNELGGFSKKTIFNEDMIFAGNAQKKGYLIAYEAKAEVIHSHNYKNMEQFHRNFDLGVSQSQNQEIFSGIRSETEGIRLVKQTAVHLWKTGHPFMILHMLVQSAFKFAGYRLGKNYAKLSKNFVIKCSMNKSYWQ